LQSRTSIKTGSTVLAIKAEILRQEQKISPHSICIIPTTISYTPLAPKDNKILQLAKMIAKKLPERLEEELTVEGSLLLNSKIIIHFEKPIFISDYITKEKYIEKILNKTQESIAESKVSKYRIPISLRLANDIYQNCIITHEHVISAIFKHTKHAPINKENLIYYVISAVVLLQRYSNIKEWHENLKGEKLFNNFNELQKSIDQLLELLLAQKLIRIENNLIYLEQKFFQEQDFEKVRIENITKLFLNEIGYFTNIDSVIKNLLKETPLEITKTCFEGIEKAYIQKHQLTFNAKHSIQIQYGKPIFLQNSKVNAVLLVHGYKSSPFEMYNVAKFLHAKGYTCYCVRMAGHGTSPFDMATTTQDDWYRSVESVYKYLSFAYQNVAVCGFSTGGLITTRLAINYEIPKIVLINSALKLEDIRFRYVKIANFWSEIAHKLSKEHKGYIEEKPYFADTNYAINHFSCMVELSKLMEYCTENLHMVKANTLIINSNKDPVVSPESGDIIYKLIASQSRKLIKIESRDHIITRGGSLKELLNNIDDFLVKGNDAPQVEIYQDAS
jgi:carboxylesterase